MMKTQDAGVETVDLPGGRRIEIERDLENPALKIRGADRQVLLTILLTSSGLTIRTDGDLAIDARRIAIHGREGVALTSDGAVNVFAAGDLETRARIQTVTAELGNVNIRANDDVKLNGERIMMNC